MQKIVGVKFKNTCKTYYFAPAENEIYERGMTVIVETAKGLETATVVLPLKEVTDEEVVAPLKPIVRIAKPKDLERMKKNEERRPEAMKFCRELVEKHKLEMKIIDCEFAFDGSKIVFSFSAPTRVDFRELVKDLATEYHTRIELRQVGIRDETRILGGIAPCGRPCCCAQGGMDFKKVTIKMAKSQGLSLNPGKISGLCGRLMCCLAYENEYYSEACKKVPTVGGEVGTPEGNATVVSVNMLTMQAKVKIENKEGGLVFKDYAVSDLQFKRNCKLEKEDPNDDLEELPPEND
ncbi:MAG: stage 0 sporulation family protein [Clostridia bacterium]|nr:stage 0 sporulation family protein [Clostridia bacterium]